MEVDETLSAQIDYYRRRAPEYDETSVECVESANRRYGALVENSPSGDVLEIACGTGLWTQHLGAGTRSLTALDSSPEMIELAKSRIGDRASTYIVADVFAWNPDRRYDSVFFGFWLSHVPPQRFAAFWELLDRCLAPGGRVLFVDEGVPRASMEKPDRCLGPDEEPAPPAAGTAAASSEPSVAGDDSPIVKRRLRDGTTHRVVKIFHEPKELSSSLAELGWSAEVELTDEGFITGVAQRV